MIMATLTKEECAEIGHTLSNINHAQPNEVLIAFDPLDRAFKFKINKGIWSPPVGTFLQPDNASLRSWVDGLRELITEVARTAKFRIHQ